MTLYDLVLEEIQRDIQLNELECLEELISRIDEKILIAYLSEESQKKLTSEVNRTL